MRLGNIRWFAVGALSLTVACSTLLSRDVSEERPKDYLKFTHEVHIEYDVECVYCHEGVEEAVDFSTSFKPKEEACMMCHDDAKEAGECGLCHADEKNPSFTYPKEEHHLKFSHKAHLARVDSECRRCHTVLPEPGPVRNTTPTMDGCLTCHQKTYDDLACDQCHEDLVTMPLEPVSMFSHKGDFVQTHRLDARSEPEACMQCHDQTHCADCHAKTVAAPLSLKLRERLDRGFIHRNDFAGRHMIEARADPALCQRCHGTSFCDSCHQLQNLTPFGTDPRNPHPPGYSLPTSAQFHGTEARRDISRCAACHDQGARSICVDCHSVGGVGGNPHPDSWLDRHDDSEIRSNSMCRYCHL